MSLYELGQRSGINRSNLHRLENGVIVDPSQQTLNRIAKALGADPEELYDAALGSDPAALPALPTYFRTRYQLSDEQIQQIEELVEATGKKPRKAAPKKKPTST